MIFVNGGIYEPDNDRRLYGLSGGRFKVLSSQPAGVGDFISIEARGNDLVGVIADGRILRRAGEGWEEIARPQPRPEHHHGSDW